MNIAEIVFRSPHILSDYPVVNISEIFGRIVEVLPHYSIKF